MLSTVVLKRGGQYKKAVKITIVERGVWQLPTAVVLLCIDLFVPRSFSETQGISRTAQAAFTDWIN
jgi:hypothetical protein